MYQDKARGPLSGPLFLPPEVTRLVYPLGGVAGGFAQHSLPLHCPAPPEVELSSPPLLAGCAVPAIAPVRPGGSPCVGGALVPQAQGCRGRVPAPLRGGRS